MQELGGTRHTGTGRHRGATMGDRYVGTMPADADPITTITVETFGVPTEAEVNAFIGRLVTHREHSRPAEPAPAPDTLVEADWR